MTMNILNGIIKSHSGEFTSLLTAKGFNLEQAKQFLPAAADQVMKAAPQEGIAGLLSGNGASVVAGLMQKIDIGALASAAGINAEMATTGLNALLPRIVKLLGNDSGALGGLLGGNDNLLGGVKKLFS